MTCKISFSAFVREKQLWSAQIKKIYFDIQKGIDETDFIISNIKIDNEDNLKKSEETFIIKNIQNLRASFRKVLLIWVNHF